MMYNKTAAAVAYLVLFLSFVLLAVALNFPGLSAPMYYHYELQVIVTYSATVFLNM